MDGLLLWQMVFVQHYDEAESDWTMVSLNINLFVKWVLNLKKAEITRAEISAYFVEGFGNILQM